MPAPHGKRKNRRVLFLALCTIITALMAGCLGRLPGSDGTAITIRTTPVGGAAIFIDGQDTGATTPHTFRHLEPGVYQVTLVRLGYPEVNTQVHVIENRHLLSEIDLAGQNISLTGYVTESRGGSGVSGAKVEAANIYTITDTTGRYELYVPLGVHDVIATKPGRAVGVAQGVVVSPGMQATANIIQRDAFSSEDRATQIKLEISGVEPDQVLVRPVDVTIEMTGPHHTRLLNVRIGHQDPLVTDFETTGSALSFTLDPLEMGPGQSYLLVTAYDIEYNSVQKVVPFAVGKTAVAAGSLLPPSPHLVAYTTSQSTRYFGTVGSGSTSTLLERPGSLMTLTSRPSHFVSIEWDSVHEASGYRIYRRIGEYGSFQALADIPIGRTSYLDADPLLRPGPSIYYRLAAFDDKGNLSTQSDPVMVFLLEPFSVYLVSPQHGSVQSVAGGLEFTWQATKLPYRPGASYEYTYDFRLQKATAQNALMRREYTNVEQARVSTLAPCSQYEWDLVAASATLRISDQATAVSASGREMKTGASLNGAYTFSTECQ